MSKQLNRNIWLINKYSKQYLKESGRMKDLLADKLKELQIDQVRLVKELGK